MSLSLTRRRAALAAGALATAVFASTAVAAPEQESAQFFLRQQGCGAAQELGTLSLEKGTDSANGCGTIGGLPLQEAFYQVEGQPLSSYEYSTVGEDGVPLVLDAEQDLTGVISTRSWLGTVGGVGEVVIEVTVTGRTLDANGKPTNVTLGEGTFSKAASPTSPVVSIPVSFDLAGTEQGKTFTALSLSLVARGANLNAGAQSLNGTSFLTVPTLVEAS